jgi:HSP20 family protein
MAGIITGDEIKRLHRRMKRLMEDWGLTELEARYLEEMQKIQKRIEDLMKGSEVPSIDRNIMTPLADVRETEEAIMIIMDLPGIEKQDVDITILDGEIRVIAERKTGSEIADKEYHKRERIHTEFHRTIKLPIAVKAEEAQARLNNGILEVTIPKEMVAARRRISID